MAYPATKTTFTDPDGTTRVDTGVDHAGNHKAHNDLLEAIEDTLGTTAGTSVLKNFAAGNFPARINSSNVLQQTLQGTINNSVLGSPTITGGTIAAMQLIGTTQITGGTLGTAQTIGGTVGNALLGTPKITVGSDAEGDMYYRDSGGSVARLGIGSNGQVITTDGTTPSWTALSGITTSGSFADITAGQTFTNAGATVSKSTVAITSGSANILAQFSMDAYCSTGTIAYAGRISRDGTNKTNPVGQMMETANSRGAVSGNFIDTNVGVGTYVYEVVCTNLSGTHVVTVGYGNFSVMKFQ